MNRSPQLFELKKDCCGCSACGAICPQEAIIFKHDEQGFLYPFVEKEKCIGCHLCEKVCAYKKDLEQERNRNNVLIWGAKNKSRDILCNSSSGGVFTAISDSFLDKNWAVASCIYNKETNNVVLEIYEKKEIRDSARGSKYIQAEIGDAFKKISKWLIDNDNKKMLVVGTGCQIAGLDRFLKLRNLRERVLLVDLICHGAPSSGLWKKYSSLIEEKWDTKIESLSFKDKRNGWENPTIYALMKGQEISISGYAEWFYGGWSLRESCYQCPYTRVDRMSSDITIGDYWGVRDYNPDFYDNMGVSLIIAQTDNGKVLVDDIAEALELIEISEEECMQPRLISPQERPANRDDFWRDMKIHGIEYCEKKYRERRDGVFIRVLKKIYHFVKN